MLILHTTLLPALVPSSNPAVQLPLPVSGLDLVGTSLVSNSPLQSIEKYGVLLFPLSPSIAFSYCCSSKTNAYLLVNYEKSIIHFSSQNSSRNVTLFSQDRYYVAVIVCIYFYIALVIPETLSTQQAFTNFVRIHWSSRMYLWRS